ncbi:MAG: glycosyl hydrolase family 2, partial [Duncaniella sp.]|nr:glycosyl hydrolase family 2 [Duncaniella sp.]
MLKFASSAAHVTGKNLTSAETLTWLTQHFRTSLARCKPEIDQMLCSGVNHVYFHGAPYSPKGVDFPGWMFYASINMSPTNSIWGDASELFRYITRCQAFLSAGEPDNDFLLYFPLEDIWYQQDGAPDLMFDMDMRDVRMPEVKRA